MDKKGMVEITWYITDACNLRCKHCYHGQYAKEVDLSEKQRMLENKIVNEIIELSKSWEIECVRFLGGEPLLNPNIFEYIRVLKETVNCEIGIGTNGLLLDEEKIKLFKELEVDKIQISLDSSDSNEHDFYRGKGTYDKTIRIIKKLVENDMRPSIRMTVSNLNYNNVDNFVQLGKDLDVLHVSLNKYIPNKDDKLDSLKALSRLQHKELMIKIKELSNIHGADFVITEDPCMNDMNKEYIFEEFAEELQEGAPIGGCTAGLVNIIITKEGKIHPCTMLPMEIGDINKNSLIDIWENENDIMNKLRDRGNYLKGKCGKCDSKLICGGCRSAAYKMTGDFLAEDPFCSKRI